jgi:hypothetical protein
MLNKLDVGEQFYTWRSSNEFSTALSCQKPYHAKEACWFLHGKPIVWKLAKFSASVYEYAEKSN